MRPGNEGAPSQKSLGNRGFRGGWADTMPPVCVFACHRTGKHATGVRVIECIRFDTMPTQVNRLYRLPVIGGALKPSWPTSVYSRRRITVTLLREAHPLRPSCSLPKDLLRQHLSKCLSGSLQPTRKLIHCDFTELQTDHRFSQVFSVDYAQVGT